MAKKLVLEHIRSLIRDVIEEISDEDMKRYQAAIERARNDPRKTSQMRGFVQDFLGMEISDAKRCIFAPWQDGIICTYPSGDKQRVDGDALEENGLTVEDVLSFFDRKTFNAPD